jgi:hypothetical protein
MDMANIFEKRDTTSDSKDIIRMLGSCQLVIQVLSSNSIPSE